MKPVELGNTKNLTHCAQKLSRDTNECRKPHIWKVNKNITSRLNPLTNHSKDPKMYNTTTMSKEIFGLNESRSYCFHCQTGDMLTSFGFSK